MLCFYEEATKASERNAQKHSNGRVHTIQFPGSRVMTQEGMLKAHYKGTAEFILKMRFKKCR